MLSSDEKWKALSGKVSETRISSLFSYLQDNGIEPLTFKGWAIGRYYPANELRLHSDIDIAVKRSDFEKAGKLLTGNSVIKGSVDLHEEFRDLDTMKWDEVFARSLIVNVENTPVRIPCPEDHLRLLAMHWLIDGGVNRERLWDIYYLIDTTPEFDLNKSLAGIDQNRQKWILTVISLTNKYLGLNIDRFGLSSNDLNIPKWMTKCLDRVWAIDFEPKPLSAVIFRPKDIIAQISLKMPPNPIHASVMCNAPFNDSSRLPYQIKNFFQRSVPSVKRISSAILSKRK